jgi:hypothetical protein
MTNVVYFAGGEDTSGTAVGTVSVSTVTTTFRANFARESLGIIGAVADPPTNRFVLNGWPAQTTFWFHAESYVVSTATTNNCQLLALLDSGGVARLCIRGTGTAGQLRLETRTAAGVFTTLVTSAAAVYSAALHALDVFVNYSTSGRVTVYLDGVSIMDTGAGVNVTTDSATALANAYVSNCGTGNTVNWSELLVMDSSTLGAGVWTLTPQAPGNTQSWTPNTLANINKTAISDTTYVSTTAVNALSEWTTPITPPGGTWLVPAIVQEARVSVGATGPLHLEWLCRTIDGTDHVSGSVAPTTSFANYTGLWPTNPHSGSAWLIGDIATGFNLGIESLT